MRDASRTCSSVERDALGGGGRDGELEDLERRTRIAACARGEEREDLGRRLGVERCRPASEDHDQLLLRQRGQLDHRAAREQRRVHLEVRVLGGRPDERDEPVLDGVEDGVLLCLVEAVDLVDEEDRPELVAAQSVARSRDHGPDVVDARRHGGDLLEGGTGPLGDDAGDRRLSGARRPEEDHRRRAVVLDGASQRRAGPEHMLLTHEVVERRRPQAHRERGVLGLALARRFGEEVGHARSMLPAG